MRIKIIGSAAGGGFPQWNCNYYLSKSARARAAHVRARTQSSIIASGNGHDWALFNASPDIRTQIAENEELHPSDPSKLRSSPIAVVVLTNADVDHIAGLLSLREQQAFAIYATARVLKVLEDNSIFNVVNKDLVARRELKLNERTELHTVDGRSLGIWIEAFAVPGKVALFLEDASRAEQGYGSEDGDTIGVKISDLSGSEQAFYIPGCADVDAALEKRLTSAQLLMFDGTVFTDDEMPRAGISPKTGQRMGHIAISGADGSIVKLANVQIDRKIYLHINNTNPILDDLSKEAEFVRSHGWDIAYDGMEVSYE
jgi:pyrroloquinoline quinone biosynthesis protein B